MVTYLQPQALETLLINYKIRFIYVLHKVNVEKVFNILVANVCYATEVRLGGEG